MSQRARPLVRTLLPGLLVFGIGAATPGCSSTDGNETAGTMIGSVAGAVIGSEIGKGDGRAAAVAIGAVIGAIVGGNVGRYLDDQSRFRADAATRQALDHAPIGEPITWENPDNASGPAHGSATVTRQGSDSEGRNCREFQQTVTVGGRREQSLGTACRDENGDWQIVSS